MSHVTPKAVSTFIFTAAALGIGYRIATSPERGSRSLTPNSSMAPRGRPRKGTSQAQDSQPVVVPRRSNRLTRSTDAEDSEPTAESRRGSRRNADSESEDSESTVGQRIGRRRSRSAESEESRESEEPEEPEEPEESEEPEDVEHMIIGTPRLRRRSIAPETIERVMRRRSGIQPREGSPAEALPPYHVARLFSASGPYIRDFSGKFMEAVRLRRREGSMPDAPKTNRFRPVDRPTPPVDRQSNASRDTSSSRSSSADHKYPSPPRSPYIPRSPPRERHPLHPYRLLECIGRLVKAGWVAYCVGIVVFILAAILMWNIDGFHSRQRTRVPDAIIEVLFLEPLERYTSMEAEFETISSHVGAAQASIATVAKLVPRCHPQGVGGHPKACGFADEVHKLESDLVAFKFRAPKLLDKEKKQICKDLAKLSAELRIQANAADAVNKLIGGREKHALALVDQTRNEKGRVTDMRKKTPHYDTRQLQDLVPDNGKLPDPEEESARLKTLENDLARAYRNLDTFSDLALGKAFERAEEDASRISKRYKLLKRWLHDREVDAELLRVQLGKVAQHDLVQEVCGGINIKSDGREGLLKRPILHMPSIPAMPSMPFDVWYKSGKKAACERLCGQSDDS